MQEAEGKRNGISGSTLKWIAVFSMFIDHSAHIFLSQILVSNGIYSVSNISIKYIQELVAAKGSVGFVYAAYLILRGVIGRIAFPIFCFLLVEGFQYTRSRAKYAGRLFLFCLISEIPFDLAFYNSTWKAEDQNVFFTLLIGFLCMWGMEEVKLFMQRTGVQSWWIIWLAQVVEIMMCCAAAELICCDYGAKGVAAIVLLYLFRNSRGGQLLACGLGFFWEPGALLALFPIGYYNGKKGRSLKYFFYIFYPAHLLVLYLLAQYLLQSGVCFVVG